MEKHVYILRTFRDHVLLACAPGRAFVNFYYKVSPPIANIISRHESLRLMTRTMLLPLVGMAYLMTTYGVAPSFLVILFFLLAAGTLFRIFCRRFPTYDR